MKWFSHLSIYYKFNTIILGIFVLILIMGTIIIQTSSKMVADQLEKRGVELAAYISALSTNDILLDDRYALLDRINKTKNHSDDVRYIIVADSRGRILAHTFGDCFPKGLPTMVSWQKPNQLPGDDLNTPDIYQVSRYDSSEGFIREILLPVENGNIGFIRIGLSEKGTEQIVDRGKKNFIITLVLFCLVAVIGSIYLAIVVVKPLRLLTRAADQIRHGNFQVDAPVTGADEIGELSGVFNKMARSLEEKQTENVQLLEELRAKEAIRAQLIKKLFVVQEDERKRLSRELHDETGQMLASLLAYMKLLQSKLTTNVQKELLLKARELTIDTLGGLKKTAVELRPAVLDDVGLSAAMNKYIEDFGKCQGVKIQMLLPDDKAELGMEISLALYRILQESLTNIAKHARATNVEVSLTVAEKVVRMVIKDDGIGIGGTFEEANARKTHLGLYGMIERAELLGGSLEIESTHGKGTTVSIVLPRSLGG